MAVSFLTKLFRGLFGSAQKKDASATSVGSGEDGGDRVSLPPLAANKTAIVLAAHGERGGDMRNASLQAHVGSLLSDGIYKFVGGGVLNGTPELNDVLQNAKTTGAERILVYPLFMSSGYFVDTKLPGVLADAGCAEIGQVLNPLGGDAELPEILLSRAVSMARKENLSPANARLLVVGHGSKSGTPASARATQRFAGAIRGRGMFKEVDVSFLEEAPFLADVLKASSLPTVVVGYFFAAGLHAAEDVPEAITETGVDALYIGAVGGDPEITDLIRSEIQQATA